MVMYSKGLVVRFVDCLGDLSEFDGLIGRWTCAIAAFAFSVVNFCNCVAAPYEFCSYVKLASSFVVWFFFVRLSMTVDYTFIPSVTNAGFLPVYSYRSSSEPCHGSFYGTPLYSGVYILALDADLELERTPIFPTAAGS